MFATLLLAELRSIYRVLNHCNRMERKLQPASFITVNSFKTY